MALKILEKLRKRIEERNARERRGKSRPAARPDFPLPIDAEDADQPDADDIEPPPDTPPA